MATAPTTIGFTGTGDFVTTTLNGAISSGASTATIGTGLNIPSANGILQIDYDSPTSVGSDNGPETIQYSTYTSGTGALTGLTRGADAYTTGVAHANGATVQAGLSALHLNNIIDVIENSGWTSYTPTVAQGASTNISKTVNYSKYLRLGTLIIFQFRLSMTAASGGAGSAITVSLPVTAAFGTATVIGIGEYFDSGTASYTARIGFNNTTTVAFSAASDTTTGASIGGTPAVAVASGDVIQGTVVYEAA